MGGPFVEHGLLISVCFSALILDAAHAQIKSSQVDPAPISVTPQPKRVLQNRSFDDSDV